MLDTAAKRFAATRHMDYETDCLVAAARVKAVSCHVVEDLIWCEIDDESHLARARELIYPTILEQQNTTVAPARQGIRSRPAWSQRRLGEQRAGL